MLVNWEPWSEWINTLFRGFLLHTAMSKACRTSSVVWRLWIDQPTTRREYKSIKTARQAKPSVVLIYVMSVTHAVSGTFPKRFNLTPRCVVWSLIEVEDWVESRRQDSIISETKRPPFPDVRQRKFRPVRT